MIASVSTAMNARISVNVGSTQEKLGEKPKMSNPKGVKAKEVYDIVQRLSSPLKLRLLLDDIKKNETDTWNSLDIRNWESIINSRIEDIMDKEANRVVGEAMRED